MKRTLALVLAFVLVAVSIPALFLTTASAAAPVYYIDFEDAANFKDSGMFDGICTRKAETGFTGKTWYTKYNATMDAGWQTFFFADPNYSLQWDFTTTTALTFKYKTDMDYPEVLFRIIYRSPTAPVEGIYYEVKKALTPTYGEIKTMSLPITAFTDPKGQPPLKDILKNDNKSGIIGFDIRLDKKPDNYDTAKGVVLFVDDLKLLGTTFIGTLATPTAGATATSTPAATAAATPATTPGTTPEVSPTVEATPVATTTPAETTTPEPTKTDATATPAPTTAPDPDKGGTSPFLFVGIGVIVLAGAFGAVKLLKKKR
jgi:hypothetical protein